MSDPTKPRWPWAEAYKVAIALVDVLSPFCERIEIAGSIRRNKATVGDIELLYIPRMAEREIDFFTTTQISLMDETLGQMLATGVIRKREGKTGGTAWGAKNKLAIHRDSGIPIDFFATTTDAWHNYLVCRTGPAESNMRIAQAAQARGWKWHPYGIGFTNAKGESHACASEMDVFHHVGLPYLSSGIR